MTDSLILQNTVELPEDGELAGIFDAEVTIHDEVTHDLLQIDIRIPGQFDDGSEDRLIRLTLDQREFNHLLRFCVGEGFLFSRS